MAYSRIEQAYLDGLVQAQFPDPVEPEPTLLASADTGITTDGGAYVGTRLNMPKGLNTPENMQAVGNDIPKTVAGVAKGMAQGFVGLPGDLEGIGRLVLNYMGADVNEQTKLPTTQDVKGFLDQYIKLPELQTGDMSNFETAGEWLAPGGQLKAVKPVAKAIKGAVKMTEGLPVGLSTKAVGEGVDDLGFYSAAAKAVDAIQQPKGTGEQFLAQITKTPGVKQDEIMWTGLDDFLKSKKTVTKQEVQDYLANNRVEIKEVKLGEVSKEETVTKLNDVLTPYGYSFKDTPITGTGYFDANGKQVPYVALPSDAREALYKAEREIRDPKLMSKYDKYTLPGGENYREVLLTLPEQGKVTLTKDNVIPLTNSPEASDPERFWYFKAPETMGGEQVYQIPKSKYPDESQAMDYIIKTKQPDADPRMNYQSGHFKQSNILAHLRVDDRIDVDGKKVLMVEEVQSDWHQAGRKRGYASDVNSKAAKAMEEYKSIIDKVGDIPWVNVPQEVKSRLDELRPLVSKGPDGVPDAPFKTTWQELAMKRAIQMASEGGYDRIAFTTGKIQNQRYNLSNQINEASAIANKDGTYNLVLEDKSGNEISEFANSGKRLTPQELEDTVGKDLAKKLIDGADSVKDKPWPKSASVNPAFFSVRGVDLDIGGEGMKGFYDNILPKFLDKYAKKWDAKTGMSEIKAGDKNEPVHYIDITPKMRESVVTKGQPMFAIGAGGAGAATQQNQEKK